MTISDAKTIKAWKWLIFSKSRKRWSLSCYTDRLLANQIARKPVRIRFHIIMCNKCCEGSSSKQFLISEERSLLANFTSPAPLRLLLMVRKKGCTNHCNNVIIFWKAAPKFTPKQFILQIEIKQVIFQFELRTRQSHPLFTRIENAIELCKGYFSLKLISKGGKLNYNTSCKENWPCDTSCRALLYYFQRLQRFLKPL